MLLMFMMMLFMRNMFFVAFEPFMGQMLFKSMMNPVKDVSVFFVFLSMVFFVNMMFFMSEMFSMSKMLLMVKMVFFMAMVFSNSSLKKDFFCQLFYKNILTYCDALNEFCVDDHLFVLLYLNMHMDKGIGLVMM